MGVVNGTTLVEEGREVGWGEASDAEERTSLKPQQVNVNTTACSVPTWQLCVPGSPTCLFFFSGQTNHAPLTYSVEQ